MEKLKTVGMWLLIVSAAAVGAQPAVGPDKSVMVMFQEAQYQEQTAGDLDKAIELYQQVVQDAAEVERLAARATFQLGMCWLKKGDKDKAAEYFTKVVKQYPAQKELVDKARTQLEKISPQGVEGGVFSVMPHKILERLGQLYGQVGSEAGEKGIYSNCHIHYIDERMNRYSGGFGYYQNTLSIPFQEKVNLTGTSNPDMLYYDVSGRKMDIEIVPVENKKNFYTVYWTPQEPVAPGQFFLYGWTGKNEGQKLLSVFGGKSYNLVMQNYFGPRVLETFYLVFSESVGLKSSTEDYTTRETYEGHTIYSWNKDVPKDTNHVVTATVVPLESLSPEEIASRVENAVTIISTCAETDPKVKDSLETLKGIKAEQVVKALSSYLDSQTATIRRSAIFILWRGEFSDISPAAEKLIALCGHEEQYTRGMAAIALGAGKIQSAYDVLVKMTLEDKDGYARRCGAYALGLFGNDKALPVLEKALKDSDDMVKQNAQAAITMLTKLTSTDSEIERPDENNTQEMYNDIQPDGTIKFRNPQRIVNTGNEPITEQHFINSDFVQLTAMKDQQGNPIEFTAKHESSIYRYHVKFSQPIQPGQAMIYYSEGTITGLVHRVENTTDTFRYLMKHSPATGRPTLRIEQYLLPAGAEVLSTTPEDMQQIQKDGRIELRVEKVIPANGSLTTSFRYKLGKPDKLRSEDLSVEGWKLWGQRKLPEAEAKFEEAIAADPGNGNAYQGLGWAQFNQGKNNNAKASFEKCVELNPKNSAALNGLGWITHGNNDKDGAIGWWEKAIKAQPGATASLSGLAQVYMEKEDYQNAVKYFKMWLKVEPNNQDAKAGLEKAALSLSEKKQ